MIGCLWTRVRKQPIIALYFEFETVLMFYNLKAWMLIFAVRSDCPEDWFPLESPDNDWALISLFKESNRTKYEIYQRYLLSFWIGLSS